MLIVHQLKLKWQLEHECPLLEAPEEVFGFHVHLEGDMLKVRGLGSWTVVGQVLPLET